MHNLICAACGRALIAFFVLGLVLPSFAAWVLG